MPDGAGVGTEMEAQEEWGAVIWPGPGEAQAQPGHRLHHL